ncbi:CubicO group peptidase (beta-lactamase class C family) [Sphingobium sp. OAS761]|uniref:serine hydrolase domain-containing protein n=1 Tax=Sphingobium sp. OAS761 TaxID=2817901 RepID=UPI00209F9536|nr:serine hydrolase domain-containing protein [Sphingobium sp. OAS761]MCP1471776.1 CubicO group peptidase (beta-lactamase class C family) [Sphingobium sp. OAS761]
MPEAAIMDRNLPRTVAAMRGFVNEGVVPGAILAWGGRDGRVQYEAAGTLGFSSNVAVDERSIFRIFSQTKPITGIGAMILIEDGRIALDQPLHDILPAFADMRVVEGDDPAVTRPAARPITIRHLLTHSAGFGMASMTLGALYLKHGIAPGTRERVAGPGDLPTPTSLAELGARLATLPLAADPGTRFDYSVALDILGLVVETASGMPFETFLRTRLFDPLGMVDTGFSIRPDQVARFADLPEKKGAMWTLADDPARSRYALPYYPAGGGGLVSTAHDYARFAAMLLNEGALDEVRVLRPETVRLARSNLLPDTVAHCDLPIGQTLSGIGFGAGMSVSLVPGKRTDGMFDWPGDVPAGVFGWPGSAGTACWMDPGNDFFLLYLAQYWPSWLNGGMRPDLIAAAYTDLEQADSEGVGR